MRKKLEIGVTEHSCMALSHAREIMANMRKVRGLSYPNFSVFFTSRYTSTSKSLGSLGEMADLLRPPGTLISGVRSIFADSCRIETGQPVLRRHLRAAATSSHHVFWKSADLAPGDAKPRS